MPRVHLLRVRLLSYEQEELQRRATAQGLSLSEYIRQAVLRRDFDAETRLRRVEKLLEEALRHVRP